MLPTQASEHYLDVTGAQAPGQRNTRLEGRHPLRYTGDMKHHLIRIGLIVLLLAPTSPVSADTASLIQELQVKIQELQKQLAELQVSTTGMVESTPFRVVGVGFSETLQKGSKGDAVTRLQEFLKTKTDSYPDGLVTGYFGELTESAVRRFQTTYGIDPVGIVGPKTRAKLNEILLANPASPPPSTSSGQVAPPPAVSQVEPPPPPASVPPPPPPTPAYIPTSDQLGQPSGTFLGWGDGTMIFEFVHDPASYTRSYMIYTKKSGATEQAHGPYDVLTIGQSKTFPNGAALERLGTTGWRWTVGMGTSSEGIYEARLTARGEGSSESPSSPGRLATLYIPIQFDNFLQGIPERDVISYQVSSIPLKLRIKNPYATLYYRYRLYDGSGMIWESGLIRQSTSEKIQASFTNANGYQFASGTPYRLEATSYDNDAARNSETKQLPVQTSLFISL